MGSWQWDLGSRGVGWLKLVVVVIGVGTASGSSVAANEVTVRFIGSELLIEGDAGANQIIVRQNGNGALVVVGRGGTLINGRNWFATRRGFTNLEIRTGAGDDSVVLQRLSIAGDLDIYLGEGNNRVIGNSGGFAVGGSFDVYGGDQRDLVRLANWTIIGDLDIDLLNGPSNVNVSSSEVGGNLGIYGGGQSDRVALSDLYVGMDVDVEGFAARDSVTITGLDASSLDILTDSGNDDVALTDIVLTMDLDVVTGAGNDSISIEAVSAEWDVEILLGAGNDSLMVIALTALGELLLDGQAGQQDFLANGGAQGGEETIIVGFESVL